LNKQEAVLQEYNRARINEEAVSVERVHFYKTDRKVNPKQEDPFWISMGKLPVLVSAPHAVRHIRQKKIKMSDEFTGSIAYLVSKLTNCYGIATAKLYGGDPNTDCPCLYNDKIVEICERGKIKFVLDIHGAAREREFDVDFGTNSGKNLLAKTRIVKIVERNFLDFGLNKVSTDYFAAAGPNTIANYVARELKIPALQIEINKQFRVPGQNPRFSPAAWGNCGKC
jgi:hypothetical protein